MCFEMTQIIYLVTDNEGVTTISSFKTTALPESKTEQEIIIRDLYKCTQNRYAPHIIKIVSMFTTPDHTTLEILLDNEIAEYFRVGWFTNTTAGELINDLRYQRSDEFVQTELIKHVLDKIGVKNAE